MDRAHTDKRYYKDEQGVAEGLGKDIKRLATGKDVKSRAGQEIAKSQDDKWSTSVAEVPKEVSKSPLKTIDHFAEGQKTKNKWSTSVAEVPKEVSKSPLKTKDRFAEGQKTKDKWSTSVAEVPKEVSKSPLKTKDPLRYKTLIAR